MASNFFGNLFRITTFGESHGPGIGVVIDGCPAGIALSLQEIQEQVDLRRPGVSHYTSERNESDTVELLSGMFEGKTTGAPIALFIRNRDADSFAYEAVKDLYRPGHANFTYLKKYGIFDYRGGGRASGRETVARVAAGAIAKKLLSHFGIYCRAYLAEMGGIAIEKPDFSKSSPIFCPCERSEVAMMQKIDAIKQENDSLGGIVACSAHLPVGLGDPVYGKLEALLAFAMLSIPATKGFEIGHGFAASRMKGSEHNDTFTPGENVQMATNHAGGTLGGISTGAPLFFRVAFKPTSSIKRTQATATLSGEPATLQLPENSRHDPCVAIRAVPVVEAMTALVLADVLLMSRCAALDDGNTAPFPFVHSTLDAPPQPDKKP
jgi:chorismate synthase